MQQIIRHAQPKGALAENHRYLTNNLPRPSTFAGS
jgi:hypothetical protein